MDGIVSRLTVESLKFRHARSEFLLGTIHYDGLGVPSDAARAYGWFMSAAKRGLPHAEARGADAAGLRLTATNAHNRK